MLARWSSAVAVALAIGAAFPFALSLVSTSALAGRCSNSNCVEQGGGHHEVPTTHRAVHGGYVRPNHDPYYTGWARSPEGWVYFGPQYTVMPGRGIIDEACNLPSSTCPNTQRDGQ